MNKSMKKIYNYSIKIVPNMNKKKIKTKYMHGRVILRSQKRRY